MTDPTDPTTAYAEQVRADPVVAGPYVRGACERHLRDLAREDLTFQPGAARRALDFFELALHLASGQFEGKPFHLAPWEAFIVGSLHGWRRLDGLRRYRRAYIEAGKGSGKTPLSAGLAVLATCADGEARAETYVIARTAEQALVTFRSAAAMVEQSLALSTRLVVTGGQNPYNIAHAASMSFMRRMSSDKQGKGKSGFQPHLIIVDEYHEHDTTAMLEFFDAGTKSRRQPLTLIITNAGSGADSPCGQEHAYAVRVAQGEVEDDAYFAYVCALDEADDPFADEACWIKTNPGLPTIPGVDYLRDQVAKAKGMPSKRALVERLNFCRWTDAESPWLSREKWLAVEADALPEEIAGAPCYAALDLGLRADLTAGALVWDLSDGPMSRYAARVVVWTPADTLQQRADSDSAPYVEWAEAGHLTAVPGSVMDFGPVAQWIAQVMAEYDLQGVAYDPWKMDLLEAALDQAGVSTTREVEGPGLLLAPHPQGFVAGSKSAGEDSSQRVPLWMPRSIDALEAAILGETLIVERNPALRWAALGSVVIADASDNRRLTKRKSTTRIDAMVAMTMAMGFAAARQAPNSLLQHYQTGSKLVEPWSV